MKNIEHNNTTQVILFFQPLVLEIILILDCGIVGFTVQSVCLESVLKGESMQNPVKFLIAITLTVTFFVLAYRVFNVFNSHRNVSDVNWNAMANKIDQLADAIHKDMNPDVKKLVTAINLLGYHTDKFDDGTRSQVWPYPWIDLPVESPQISVLRKRLHEITTRENNIKELLQQRYPQETMDQIYLREDSAELNSLSDQWLKTIDELDQLCYVHLEKLCSLLARFYNNRTVDYECILFIKRGDTHRLQALGNDWRKTGISKSQKHMCYREMGDFADFLAAQVG